MGIGNCLAGVMQLTLEQIPDLATKFEMLVFDPNAKRDVELLGAAFVWSDEKPDFNCPDATIPVTRFFQYLLWYRKSLMQEKPAVAFTVFWEAFHKACPTWPGFRPERCAPPLLDELNAEVDVMMKKLKRELEACDRQRLFDRSEKMS